MSWISVGNQEAQPKRISSFEQKGGAISGGRRALKKQQCGL